MTAYPSFCNGSYESMAVTADQERTVNFYFEPMESQGATSASALYPTPGVEEIGEASTSPGRAHFFENSREFAVIGTTFYEINVSGVFTSRGTVTSSANPATISSNGDGGGQLFITSGDNGYIYDTTSHVFTQVAALNGIATMGDQIDGYFLSLDGASSTLRISDLLDGLTWDPTQFAQRSRAPDPWVSMRVAGIYIYLFGEVTSEPWYNTGERPFPFAPYPSLLIPYGIAAPFSAAVSAGSITWLGATGEGDCYVLKAAGFTPEEVSDYPRALIFSGYTTISDAQADCIDYLGHSFYLLTFPTENVTWAYDAKTRKWTEWETWISENNEFVAWRPRWHAMAFGEHRMLDASTGSVYRLSPSITTDVDGRPIRRMRRAPALTFENRRIFYPGFELDLEPGLGTSTGQGFDPQVMHRFSNDGGKTWSNETMCSAGKIGEYGTRVRWNRLGSARRRVEEVTMTDPNPWRITGAYLTPDPYPLPKQGRT